MTTPTGTANTGSAKIYTFPPRGRFALAGQRERSELAAANVHLPRGAAVACGSAWYHDEAIQAEQRRKF